MTDAAVQNWFLYAFPVFFAGMWLVVTTMLGLMSGWFSLQRRYPDDGREKPLLALRGQSGMMGSGVSFNGILRLQAYPSGLGIGVWRVFGPFLKPLRVPWAEIEAEDSSSFLMPMMKLRLGRPANGTLKISVRNWARLVEVVPQASRLHVQMLSAQQVRRRSSAEALVLQWLAIIAFAAAFFYFGPRLMGAEVAPPISVCIGFPAIVVGILQLIRYVRES